MKGTKDFTKAFSGKRVLITGGAGFIGSNCAIRLVESGANVSIVDSMVPDCGGNLFNFDPIKDKVSFSFTDIGDEKSIIELVKGKDYITPYTFHLKNITQ